MFKIIAVIGCLIIASSGLSAADINLDFLKRLTTDKKKHDELQAEGKPQKAQSIWDQNNNKLQSLFKAGAWYTLPSSCAAYRRQYSDQIHIECQIPEVTSKEQTVPKIDLSLLSQKLTLKWEDATNDTPYEIKFRIARYRDIDSAYIKSPWKTGYIHTFVDGFTLYVDAFQILGQKKPPNQTSNQADGNSEKLSYEEKVAIMSRELAPMMQNIDYQSQFIPTKAVKGLLSNGLANSCKVPDAQASKDTVKKMHDLSREKQLPLDLGDLQSYARYEICSIVNGGVAESPCLDACFERMADVWD